MNTMNDENNLQKRIEIALKRLADVDHAFLALRRSPTGDHEVDLAVAIADVRAALLGKGSVGVKWNMSL